MNKHILQNFSPHSESRLPLCNNDLLIIVMVIEVSIIKII
jgi:hypothetical protein